MDIGSPGVTECHVISHQLTVPFARLLDSLLVDPNLRHLPQLLQFPTATLLLEPRALRWLASRPNCTRRAWLWTHLSGRMQRTRPNLLVAIQPQALPSSLSGTKTVPSTSTGLMRWRTNMPSLEQFTCLARCFHITCTGSAEGWCPQVKSENNSHSSCCVEVKGNLRCMYLLPRKYAVEDPGGDMEVETEHEVRADYAAVNCSDSAWPGDI